MAVHGQLCKDAPPWIAAPQVGIITLQTPREVAVEAGVPLESISLEDERVGALVITGQQLRWLGLWG